MRARLACLFFCLLLPPLAAAQQAPAAAYPNKPITIIVGFSAGGTTDIVARLAAEELRKSLGQNVIVENKVGAGGNIGADLVAKARPDGYTLLMGSVGPLAVNISLYKNLPFDNLKDFTPISQLVHVPNVLVVNPVSLPVTSLGEFTGRLKEQPGRYFYPSTGVGTSSHLSGELFNTMTGIKSTHVPYKGAVALTDLLAGDQVQYQFATIPSVIQYVRAGRLRAIAVTSLARSASMPDVPTVAESGYPEFEASSWFGVLGPRDLPRDIVDKLHAELVRIVRIPELRERLIQQGADPVGSTPEEFAAYIRAETQKWARVVKISGAKPE